MPINNVQLTPEQAAKHRELITALEQSSVLLQENVLGYCNLWVAGADSKTRDFARERLAMILTVHLDHVDSAMTLMQQYGCITP